MRTSRLIVNCPGNEKVMHEWESAFAHGTLLRAEQNQDPGFVGLKGEKSQGHDNADELTQQCRCEQSPVSWVTDLTPAAME